MDQDGVWMVVLSVTICVTFTFTLGACLCCRRKVHKNDLLGLEGRMVAMCQDDSSSGKAQGNGPVDSGDHAKSNGSDQTDHHHRENEKRTSGATHRSLPDIPTVDDIEAVRGSGSNDRGIHVDNGPGGNGQGGDTNSDLYATVGDKVVVQRAMPGHVLDHKQASISQHSSLSQADDISSPYASVRSPPHAYDKIRKAEHPYAQLQPTASNAIAETSSNGSRRASSESLLGSDVEESGGRQVDIPAASAIAGRVSASQELPYMTPPIVQPAQAQSQPPLLLSNPPAPQLHFSGDSQDSSKGYTSISVREPLANILAQTKSAQQKHQQSMQQRKLAREFQDSHYATVSDDSDEMYAAIEDPNAQGELYTSGSETYAQIQPMVVNVEVNSPQSATVPLPPPPAGPMERSSSPSVLQGMQSSITSMDPPPAPPALPSGLAVPSQVAAQAAAAVSTSSASSAVIAAQHSRQASSSSSIGGILGSPKPEKRQANSPLPPTPKSNAGAGKASGHYLSNTTLNSGRNSVASYNIDFSSPSRKEGAVEGIGKEQAGEGGKKRSPSKDLEGMYAKVMKKNKLSSAPSENSSPIFGRRGEVDLSELSSSNTGSSREGSAEKQQPTIAVGSVLMEQNNYETIERKTVTSRRTRDPGYETIPGDKCRRDLMDSLNANAAVVEGSAGSGTVAGKNRNSAPAGILADGIHRVSQNSLNILKGGVAIPPEGVTTLLADEPLSLISNDDPGYETVRQVGGIQTTRKISLNESSSEHDPNYETLLPNCTTTAAVAQPVKSRPQSRRFGDDEEDDGYSKITPGGGGQQPVVVLKKVTTTSSSTDNEGYSSIRAERKSIIGSVDKDRGEDEEEAEPGYSQIGTATGAKQSTHGYASIDETKKDQLEGYSTIQPPGIMTASITSVTTTNSSVSPISPIGYFPVPPSAETSSYSSNTSPSSEFSSSDVNLHRSQGLVMLAESNNYESLTSEDPNYETVRHLRITENPYEVLENDLGTPGVVGGGLCDEVRAEGDRDLVTVTKGEEEDRGGKVSPSDSPEVGDYFQV